MKKYLFVAAMATLTACDPAVYNGVLKQAGGLGSGTLSQADIASGLKQALEVGISNGADQASQTDGFFLNPKIKIPFPPDVQRVERTLRQVGLGNEVDRFVLSLNRGAELAAREARPVFMTAIRNLTIQDAIGILSGDRTAATEYLRRTTSQELLSRFTPIVANALQQTNATRYYGDLANTYNRIPMVQQINPDLTQYATQKAVDGLFLLVAQEEAKIRENPVARTTELLRRVFSSSYNRYNQP